MSYWRTTYGGGLNQLRTYVPSTIGETLRQTADSAHDRNRKTPVSGSGDRPARSGIRLGRGSPHRVCEAVPGARPESDTWSGADRAALTSLSRIPGLLPQHICAIDSGRANALLPCGPAHHGLTQYFPMQLSEVLPIGPLQISIAALRDISNPRLRLPAQRGRYPGLGPTSLLEVCDKVLPVHTLFKRNCDY